MERKKQLLNLYNIMEAKKFTIDAKGRSLGRVASEVASLLIGKNSTAFAKNVVLPHKVEVLNAGALKISAKKAAEKVYATYTGYPGGLNKQTLAEMITKKGAGKALENAIYGMLPGNKLRDRRMKNLTITN
jgi:large subunit ribosomal protein L13